MVEGCFRVLDVLLLCILKLQQCLVELALDFVLRVLGLLKLLVGSDSQALVLFVSLLELAFELFNLIFELLNFSRFGVAYLLLVDIF